MPHHTPLIAALADPVVLVPRRETFAALYLVPLTYIVELLRDWTSRTAPDADLADGDIARRLLLLPETPGPSISVTGF